MSIYRLWNNKLNHYQCYSCNTEIVEMESGKKLLSYIKKHSGDYTIFKTNLLTGERKEVSLKALKNKYPL